MRLAIYRTFAGQGQPPSVAGLAAQTGLPEADVRTALRQLHEAHAIVLASEGDAVRMAHPFSAAPMGFVVTAEGQGPAVTRVTGCGEAGAPGTLSASVPRSASRSRSARSAPAAAAPWDFAPAGTARPGRTWSCTSRPRPAAGGTTWWARA